MADRCECPSGFDLFGWFRRRNAAAAGMNVLVGIVAGLGIVLLAAIAGAALGTTFGAVHVCVELGFMFLLVFGAFLGAAAAT